ncbi:MAG TPA: hypothetical protein VIL11_05280, partial [Limnochordales bacterium]
CPLEQLLEQADSRSELIACFLAVLELVRLGELWLNEDESGTLTVSLRAAPSPKPPTPSNPTS